MEDSSRKLTPEIEECKNAYLQGRVVSDELVALASYSVLDEYRWVPYPTPPKEVQEYFSLPVVTKVKMNRNPESYKSFFQNPDNQKFFDLKHKIRNKNQVNKEWLQWMVKVLEEKHPGCVGAINIQIFKFSDEHLQDMGVQQPKWDE